MESLLITRKEAFRAIGVGDSTGRKLIASGEITAVKLCGRSRATRVTAESVRAYVDRLLKHEPPA